jgi:hypothetical protein
MTTPAVIPALEWEAPLVNPSPSGLYTATSWVEVSGPSRFLGQGVRIRTHNYGGEDAFGVWDAEWCVDPDGQIKTGERPGFLDPFAPLTVWAYDECDLTEQSHSEILERVQQNLRLLEQTAVERELAERLLIDAGTAGIAGSGSGLYEPPLPEADGDKLYAPFTAEVSDKLYPTGDDTITDVPDIIAAVSRIEAEFAMTNTTGFIHAGAQWAAYAARFNLITRSGAALKSPLGHTWVFGGGYVKGLENVIVGTSPTYGWRDEVQVRESIDTAHNKRIAVAERSVVVGYEQCVGAARVLSYGPCC